MTISILRARLPAPEEEVRAALVRYRAALEAHRNTVGKPAPYPEHEILFDLVRVDDFIVVDEPEVERPVLTPEQEFSLREQALSNALQNELDARARLAGYDSIEEAISYADESAVQKYQDEGRRFRAWRSLVWQRFEDRITSVRAGSSPMPSKEEIVASLPPLA